MWEGLNIGIVDFMWPTLSVISDNAFFVFAKAESVIKR